MYKLPEEHELGKPLDGLLKLEDTLTLPLLLLLCFSRVLLLERGDDLFEDDDHLALNVAAHRDGLAISCLAEIF